MSELSDALRAQRIELVGEVHDRIIPPLFAARMHLEALAARLGDPPEKHGIGPGVAPGSAPPATAEIQRAMELIQLGISESRQLLAALAPHEPGEKHWDSQLRQALGTTEVRLHQVGSLPWDRIDPETAITLTSITAEAIRNAVRHGKASRIEITTERLDPRAAGDQATSNGTQPIYQIAVLDDGQGFDPNLTTEHHGLHLMRLRAAAIGARLQISSQPGGPTQVSLRWLFATGDAADH